MTKTHHQQLFKVSHGDLIKMKRIFATQSVELTMSGTPNSVSLAICRDKYTLLVFFAFVFSAAQAIHLHILKLW